MRCSIHREAVRLVSCNTFRNVSSANRMSMTFLSVPLALLIKHCPVERRPQIPGLVGYDLLGLVGYDLLGEVHLAALPLP
jgi:hypothetical protein